MWPSAMAWLARIYPPRRPDGGFYPPPVTEPPPAPPAPPPPPDAAVLERGLEMLCGPAAGSVWRQAVADTLEDHQREIKRLEKRVEELERAGRGLAVEDPQNWESDDAD